MRNPKTQLFFSILILFIYMSIGVFGLFQFNHITETPMVNCPYTQDNYAVCGNSFSHINNWHQFSKVILSASFIFTFLLLGIVLYFIKKQDFLNYKRTLFYKWKSYLADKKSNIYLSQVISWLSLFENSPSFSYIRYS